MPRKRDSSRLVPTAPWRQLLLYGAVLAVGTFALQGLDLLWIAERQSTPVYVVAVAVAFLAIGVLAGVRLRAPRPSERPTGYPQAQAELGISGRELTVLHRLAAGRSNKEIARELRISPNTVKTHVARLFEKLEVRRRTEAIGRARELGILP